MPSLRLIDLTKRGGCGWIAASSIIFLFLESRRWPRSITESCLASVPLSTRVHYVVFGARKQQKPFLQDSNSNSAKTYVSIIPLLEFSGPPRMKGWSCMSCLVSFRTFLVMESGSARPHLTRAQVFPPRAITYIFCRFVPFKRREKWKLAHSNKK